MLSAGMLTLFAFSTAVRRRGFEPRSPPPMRAAIDISRMILVKIFPRLASSAPFLCLMEAHLECPDMPLSCSLLWPESSTEGGAGARTPAQKKESPGVHAGARYEGKIPATSYSPTRLP